MLGHASNSRLSPGRHDDPLNLLVHKSEPKHGKIPCPFPLDVETGLPVALARPAETPSKAAPACAWAVCMDAGESSAGLQYVYIDPYSSRELATKAPLLRHRPVMDFVCPDDRPRVLSQLRTMAQTRTLFGSVIRCRYAQISGIRAALDGATAIKYATTDLVVSRIGTNLALCFFHAVEAQGMCGVPLGLFDLAEIQGLWRELQACAPVTEPLSYVFQVLSASSPRQLLLSWPPPTSYHACDLAKLVQKATIQPHAHCTERLHATHTLLGAHGRAIDSVLVPCGSVVLACFSLRASSSAPSAPAALEATSIPAQPPSRPPASVPKPMARPVSPEPSTLAVATAAAAAVTAAAASSTKCCTSCGRSDSPEWRRGPSGHKTLCNACGLRYARSLTQKHKRTKDGTTLTIEATGDPQHVPPSRGSGGGSRPGAHRRGKLRRSGGPLERPSAPADTSRDFDRRLANVLTSMQHDARFAPPTQLGPMADMTSGRTTTLSAPPATTSVPADVTPSLSLPLSSTTPASHPGAPAALPTQARPAPSSVATAAALLPVVLSYPLPSLPLSDPSVSSHTPSACTSTSSSHSASSVPSLFPTPPGPNLSATPSTATASVSMSTGPSTVPMDSVAAAAALSTLQGPACPSLTTPTAAAASVRPSTSFPLSTAEETVLP
ncbi:hypothetical protein MNAN1_001770 [Malassezia nana]|uniref:GATA-type domain-containing protein n=1 Tax=Malassezia nana TaxID=180528 RepID=A0AAF0J3G1_9BASI|nr:hypothetical protein MNAN1_001770 [Malassezia nana]